MKTTTDFYRQVIRLIKMIPRGKVATYGQIAKLAGKPQGSRGVAWILPGVNVARDGRLDLAQYQWEKKPLSVKKSTRTPRMFS